ncbi:MAG TPA: hypothetical protein VIL74_25045 [Pyrinomonadaceae bacterium]|jgi:hypothetical protein
MIFTASVLAQHGYRVEKRIDFRGDTAATVKGVIPNTLEGHEYIFSARRGQNLTVGLFSRREDIAFSIVRPNGDYLSDETELRSWNGKLPEGGEYHIIINTSAKGAARYTLELTVE